MKTAVITGATGFIGKALVKHLLKKGYHVFAVTRNPEKLATVHPELSVVKTDYSQYVTLKEQIPSADIFYHIAWDGVYGASATDCQKQLDNVKAACAAIEQAAFIGCKKFVLAGTVAELEVIEHIEKNICSPRGACIYASAKLSAEMMCKTLAVMKNIEFNCGLFANIIGPGDCSHRSTNFILNKFLHNEAPKLVKGEGLNDWLYIEDAVRLIEAMGEHGQNMKTYYIGHRNLWPLRETISRARDVVAPNLKLNFGELKDEFLTNYDYTDTNALYEDTGEKAEYIFEKAIQETAAWVKALGF